MEGEVALLRAIAGIVASVLVIDLIVRLIRHYRDESLSVSMDVPYDKDMLGASIYSGLGENGKARISNLPLVESKGSIIAEIINAPEVPRK